ncbi:hypothetical protein QUC31_010175 [Theobroma cacao]
MALSSASVFSHPLTISTASRRPLTGFHRRHHCSPSFATLSSPSTEPSSSSSPPPAVATTPSSTESILSSTIQQPKPFVESSRPHDSSSLNYALANPNGNPMVRFARSTESNIEKTIFDFRFLAILAVGGSLAGSLLCFLNGCVYIVDAYKVYWTSCVKGVHTGKMVLRLVEAIDVYLAGTVMLIFGMGLYGLFISNVNPDVPADVDRAVKGSSLFGMFAMKERPKWMKISSLDELKTKVGHVIVMILLVKMFERSKMVTIATGMDLLSYSVCIFLSSASLYILHHLHKPE